MRQHGKPEITPEMRRRARAVPNNWLLVTDPGYDTTRGVPAEAVIGRYRVDARGEITGEYVANPRYQPLPDTRAERPSSTPPPRMSPTNDLERVIQAVATGASPESALVEALLDHEILVLIRGQSQRGGLVAAVVTENPAEPPVVQAYTSYLRPPAGAGVYRCQVTEFVDLFRRADLRLNPGYEPSVVVRGAQVVAAVEARSSAAGPELSDEAREQARQAPNGWLYVADPFFDGYTEEIPTWGYVGGYRVDEHGEVTRDFHPNPDYRPSPRSLGWPPAENELEEALQLVATAYLHPSALVNALLRHRFLLLAERTSETTRRFFAGQEEGTDLPVMSAFTSAGLLPPDAPGSQEVSVGEIRDLLQGVDLRLNPDHPATYRVSGPELVAAHDQAVAEHRPQPPARPDHPGQADHPGQPGPAPTPAGDATERVPHPAARSSESSESSEPSGSSEPAGDGPPPRDAPTEIIEKLPPEAAPPPPDSPAPRPALDRDERFLGSVLAGAVGDALGFGVEFLDIGQIRQRYGDAGITAFDLSHGRGGEISDDTQMTLFTLEGLIRAHVRRRRGEPADDVRVLQHAYQRWLHTQGADWPTAGGSFARHAEQPDGWLVHQRGLFAVRAPGSTCLAALNLFTRTDEPGTFEHRLNDSKGCGGVMRVAPVALWSEDPAEVFDLAARAAALTHSHPSGYLSAGVLAAIVHQLVRGAELPPAVELARSLLVTREGHDEQLQLLDRAVELAGRGRPTPELLAERLGGGWVGEEALAIGLCAALATDSAADALVVAVNHSGDSDSTGAICGNIVGAVHGTAGVPPAMLENLELRDVIETLAQDALREFGPQPPTTDDWFHRYPGW
ncbi:type VII secretion system-associated protein [Streptoalloteichus hindustanus]|uniref:ADP-ribosylglycohydrolase n=1 Tax=Streptoalloteichus hindustanus TaxID=2017 RepID=A0A1M5BKC3_STRHI|nr:type VII secretion system-associated protein [Streptoalloteichus hindustanus]SHF42918.1 ADP-ribosylglycohydrolase [Streptoalloteichus hindustanus]